MLELNRNIIEPHKLVVVVNKKKSYLFILPHS